MTQFLQLWVLKSSFRKMSLICPQIVPTPPSVQGISKRKILLQQAHEVEIVEYVQRAHKVKISDKKMHILTLNIISLLFSTQAKQGSKNVFNICLYKFSVDAFLKHVSY